jgi:glutamate-1-semialdehyde 2,1-aminomutase
MPASDRLYDRATASLPGGNTRTTLFVAPHPPYAASGRGCSVVDIDGHEVIDFNSNYTSLIHGYQRAEIVAAVNGAIAQGSCFCLPTVYEVELAERLAARISAAPKWRFTNSGTEAVMMAIRVARAATGRDAVLRFAGCYHGTYDGIFEAGAGGVPGAYAEQVVTVPVGDKAALQAALSAGGHRIACVLFDPMPNRAGLRPSDPAFVQMLRAETARHEILLVMDEVITFRLAHGGMQALYDVRPDITTLGKVLGGGFPVGAVGGRAEVLDLFDPHCRHGVNHGGTFSANPVTMRAGCVALDLLTREEIARINALGDRLRQSLIENGWNATGHGSLLRIHASDPAATWWRLYEEGVLVAPNGLMCTSTAMTEEVIDQAIAAFDRVMKASQTL